MTAERRQVKLAKNAADMERWLRKLIRAANEVDRIRRERKRLLKPREFKEDAKIVAELNDEVPSFAPEKPEAAELPAAPVVDDGLDIPAELDRSRRLQTLPDPRTPEKRAERRVIEKEKRERDLRGQARKMPPSGKAALAAIRAAR